VLNRTVRSRFRLPDHLNGLNGHLGEHCVLALSFVYVLLVVNRYMMLHGYNFLAHMKLLKSCCIFSTSVGPKDIFFLELLVIGMNIGSRKLLSYLYLIFFHILHQHPFIVPCLMLLNSK
jgi:hypothetical protein